MIKNDIVTTLYEYSCCSKIFENKSFEYFYNKYNFLQNNPAPDDSIPIDIDQSLLDTLKNNISHVQKSISPNALVQTFLFFFSERITDDLNYILNTLKDGKTDIQKDQYYYAELSLLLEEFFDTRFDYHYLETSCQTAERLKNHIAANLMRSINIQTSLFYSLRHKKILIVGSGDIDFRGYILENLYLAGCKLILLTDNELSWEKKYITDALLYPFFDLEKLLDTIKEYHAVSPFDGVLTYFEPHIELTAAISGALNLPSIHAAEADLARNKYKMRQLFDKNNVTSPGFKKIDRLSSIPDVLFDLTLPVVIKPTKGFASIGVVKINNTNEINDSINSLQKSMKSNECGLIDFSFLIEEYIEGDEYSVESFISNNCIQHISITKKFKGPLPYFEEIGHITPAPTIFLTEHIYKEVSNAVAALQLNNCALHSEVIVTKQKQVFIVEIGARLGGDKIPFITQLSTGYNMSCAAALASMSMSIPVYTSLNSNKDTYGICYFVPQQKGTLTALAPSKPDIPGIVEYKFWPETLMTYNTPPEDFFVRLGYVIISGKDETDVLNGINSVITEVSDTIGLPLQRLNNESYF